MQPLIPQDRRFLIPVYFVLLVISLGCAQKMSIITPASLAVGEHLFYADGRHQADALSPNLADVIWRNSKDVENGRILALNKYLWLATCDIADRGPQDEAVNYRLRALDPASGKVRGTTPGNPRVWNDRYIVLDNGRILALDSPREAGRLDMLASQIRDSEFYWRITGNRLIDVTTRSEAKFASIARGYELPSGKRLWDIRIPPQHHGEQLFAAQGDLLAIARVNLEGKPELVGIDARTQKETWHADAETLAFLSAVRAGKAEHPLARLRTAPLPGELLPASPVEDFLDVATGKVEKRPHSPLVAKLLSESTPSRTLLVYPLPNAVLVWHFAEERFLECLELDGTPRWKIKTDDFAPSFGFFSRSPYGDHFTSPLFSTGDTLLTRSPTGIASINLKTGAIHKEPATPPKK